MGYSRWRALLIVVLIALALSTVVTGFILGPIRHERAVGRYQIKADWMLADTHGKPVRYLDEHTTIYKAVNIVTSAPEALHPGDSAIFSVTAQDLHQHPISVAKLYDQMMNSRVNAAGVLLAPRFRFLSLSKGALNCQLLAPSNFDKINIGLDIGTAGNIPLDGTLCRWAFVPKATGTEIAAYSFDVGKSRVVGFRTIVVEEAPWSLNRLSAIAGLLTALVAIIVALTKAGSK